MLFFSLSLVYRSLYRFYDEDMLLTQQVFSKRTFLFSFMCHLSFFSVFFSYTGWHTVFQQITFLNCNDNNCMNWTEIKYKIKKTSDSINTIKPCTSALHLRCAHYLTWSRKEKGDKKKQFYERLFFIGNIK